MKNIFLSLPAVFDSRIIDFYENANKRYKNNKIIIKEVYGSMRGNTARESHRLKDISIGELIEFSKKLKKVGISFNYAINSTNLDMHNINNEAFPLIRKLRSSGIKTFTIFSSLLLYQLKALYPDLKVVLSTIAGANSLRKINQAKNFGVDRIVLDLKASREFKLLENINQIKNIEYELMVNEFCGDCLMRNDHYNLQSKGEPAITMGDGEDYPYSICSKIFMDSKNQVLKGYWILPQWMDIYRECGIKWMKITGRTIKDISWHKFVIEAYMSRSYKGNIMKLAPIKRSKLKPEGELPSFELNGREIDSANYINYFVNKYSKCDDECGVRCNYCDKLAEKL